MLTIESLSRRVDELERIIRQNRRKISAKALYRPESRACREKVEVIRRVVCQHYNVSEELLNSRRRMEWVNWPRHVALHLCRLLVTESLGDIGVSFGRRSHCTVLNSVRAVKNRMQVDTKFSVELADVLVKCQDALTPLRQAA
jgi:chromosomal replication initiation ATPase DnaA